MKKWGLVLAIFFSLVQFSFVKAEQKLEEVDCFDYYKFGGVDVDITSTSDFVPAGSTMHLQARIKNENEYPIVDGSVYVKVFQKQGKQLEENVDFSQTVPDENFLTQGDPVVDQFFALENITLDKNETKTLDFEWKVPTYLPSGKYRLANFFQSGKKFNLSGLSFTEDVIGSDMNFQVKNEELGGGVAFDKNNVKLDGQPYNFVGFLKAFEDKELSVEATITNSLDSEQRVTVTRELYYWDSLDATNKLKTEEEALTLAPKESKKLSYTIAKNSYPVNYFVITAHYGDAKSILNLRYTKNDAAGQATARINFPAVKAFPLVANQPVDIFTCAHAVKNREFLGEPQLKQENGKLVPVVASQESSNQKNYTLILNLLDEKGQKIESFNYAGGITGEMMGMKSAFTPKKSYNKFKLESILKDGQGKVVDQAVMDYDCQKINAKYCSQAEQVGVDVSGNKNKKFALGVVIAGALVVIALLVVVLRRRFKGGSGLYSIIFILSAAALFSVVPSAEAKTVQPDVVDFNGTVYYKSVSADDRIGYWWSNLDAAKATVKYSASSSLGEGDGIRLKPGDKFTVSDLTLSDPTSIDWNLTGYSVDSPWGYWRNNAELTSNIGKQENDLIYSGPAFGGSANVSYSLYAPLVFAPPNVEIETTGPVICEKQSGSRVWDCLISSSSRNGDVVMVTMKYQATYGKWYSLSNVTAGNFSRNVNDTIKKSLNCRNSSCSSVLQKVLIKEPGINAWYEYGKNCESCSDLNPNLRKASITYQYEVAASGNKVPSAPTCSGPKQLYVNQVGNFYCVSSDSNEDQITYKIDWKPDEDGPLENSDYLDQNVRYRTTKSWPTMGVKKYRAMACDGPGSCSAWSPEYEVNILRDIPADSKLLKIYKKGEGTVTVSPEGSGLSSCDADICKIYKTGTPVNIIADSVALVPQENNKIIWQGETCTGGSCNVTMNEDQTLTIFFPNELTVIKEGEGEGNVTSTSPSQTDQINCGSACAVYFKYGENIRLQAALDAKTSVSWLGCSSSSGEQCAVDNLIAAREVTATFTPKIPTEYQLNVTKSGNCKQLATITGNKINCGATCSAVYEPNANVNLQAGYDAQKIRFEGWSGAASSCGNNGSCLVNVNQVLTQAGATFNGRCDTSADCNNTCQGIRCQDACGNQNACDGRKVCENSGLWQETNP